MAENKKGFILYADQQELFSQLTDEQAGQLIKHIYAYVNDEQPESSNPLINIAFAPIKQQFKRDFKKWEKTREGRSKAGKASAEARRNKKQQKPTNSTNVNFAEQNEQKATNSTVNVNANVNVKVNVNDILLEKETKEVFNDWLEYRKEIKKPIKSERTLISLAKKINTEGAEKAKRVIEASIQNGWQGLFWDKEPPQQKTELTPQQKVKGELAKELKESGINLEPSWEKYIE